MKIALINGSPRVKESNSAVLLSDLKEIIYNKNSDIKELKVNKNIFNNLDCIYDCDTLIFAFPLYVDGLPANFLKFLIECEKHFKLKPKKNIIVYTIVNCGFFEGNQTHIAISIIENWCKKVGFTFGQGVGVGGGEMLNLTKSIPLGHGPKKNLGRALNNLGTNILNNCCDENIFISPNFPRFMFKLFGNIMWGKMAKQNGLTTKDLFRK